VLRAIATPHRPGFYMDSEQSFERFANLLKCALKILQILFDRSIRGKWELDTMTLMQVKQLMEGKRRGKGEELLVEYERIAQNLPI
jgi:hypothetical protein